MESTTKAALKCLDSKARMIAGPIGDQYAISDNRAVVFMAPQYASEAFLALKMVAPANLTDAFRRDYSYQSWSPLADANSAQKWQEMVDRLTFDPDTEVHRPRLLQVREYDKKIPQVEVLLAVGACGTFYAMADGKASHLLDGAATIRTSGPDRPLIARNADGSLQAILMPLRSDTHEPPKALGSAEEMAARLGIQAPAFVAAD